MPVAFEVSEDNRGSFRHIHTSFALAEEKLDELIEKRNGDIIGSQIYLKRLQALVAEYPDFIDGHAHLGYAFYMLGKPRKALEACLAGLSIANHQIPEGFSGTIEWWHLENRPFLRALNGAALSYAALRRHAAAIALIEKLLQYNPDDNQGMRFVLGSEYLRSGQNEAAQTLLESEAVHYPPYYYELALLHIEQKNWVAAATALRRGFAANPYIAEMLCGNYGVQPLVIWHASNFNGPDIARDYLSNYADRWRRKLEPIAFVRWLYNHSRILAERAVVLECLEELLWELSPDRRETILDRLAQIEQKMDDRSSQEIIVKRKTRRGAEIYPWKKRSPEGS